MAPVQVAGAPRRGKTPQWTPESVIREIQHFVEAHGEVPRLADFNPGQAKTTGQGGGIDASRAGCRICASAYPSANAARRCFDGSLELAIRAAGFEPAKRGPRRRTEADLSASATARHVCALGAPATPRLEHDARVAVDAALARAADAEQRSERLAVQLERARTRAAAAPKVKTKIVRERVIDAAAVARITRAREVAEARALALKS